MKLRTKTIILLKRNSPSLFNKCMRKKDIPVFKNNVKRPNIRKICVSFFLINAVLKIRDNKLIIEI